MTPAADATFYLGTPKPEWLGRASVPMFVSRVASARTCVRSWPRARGRYALDSGGFTELSRLGRWTIAPADYVAFVCELAEVVGPPDFVAPMDYMCEPFVLARTGLTLADHLRLTVESVVTLRAELGELVIPVLQGYGPRDYERCAELYAAAGVRLERERVVGVGSVCRRSGTLEANRLLRHLADAGYRLHAFGIKGATWRACRGFLTSADSMAWSYAARRQGRDRNSLAEALSWRRELLTARASEGSM